MSAQPLDVSRRRFLAQGGALVVAFAIAPGVDAQGAPGSLGNTPNLDSWIRVDADGTITVFTGKVELGQGIKTALLQIAADELRVEPRRITLVTADTARTPNEGYTAGSRSLVDSGTAILNASAQVRELLVGLAATRFGVVGMDAISMSDGTVRLADGRSATYAELVANQSLHVAAQPRSALTDPKSRRWMGQALPRIDIPAKVTGGVAYVQDLRLPNMLHARVVRPPRPGARLAAFDPAAVEKSAGVVKVVRNGSFLAVVAQREFEAIRAMRAANRAARWELPRDASATDVYADLLAASHEDFVIRGSTEPFAGAFALEATYRRPYQMHASIGPSCAVALYEKEALTVWTHSQGVYPLRGAIAEMLKLPAERVRCVHMEGAGCYGHNAADDAGADAALIAMAMPGRPVRVQWMREQENVWEPYGSAMVATAQARLQNGVITDWQFEVTSGPHSTRPGRAGNLAAAWLIDPPFALPPPQPIPQPEGGGDRNAIPLYAIPNVRVVHRFVRSPALRVSALRSLGAYMNVFAIESFMDELATLANADPVQFRLQHLRDPRAADVVRLAAERFGWTGAAKAPGRGRGFAFARYKNLAAYAAIAMEIDVDRETGRIDVSRVVAAVDSGDVVNPDGIRNQIEGGIVQSLSWTLYEAVSVDERGIPGRDWSAYPIMRFASVPRSVEVHVIERPGAPFLGTGEAAQGPAGAALANAVANATGVRIRELPLSRKRVRDALGA